MRQIGKSRIISGRNNRKDEFGTVFAANLTEEYKTKTHIQRQKKTKKDKKNKNIHNNASRY